MATLITQYGLPIVALIIFAGEIGLPTIIPGEIGLLVAGNQDIRNIWMLFGAIAVFGTIDIVATSTIHIAARTGGNTLLRRFLRRVAGNHRSPEAMVDGYRRRLGGRDSLVVFVSRLVPMFRLYASIATGLVKVDYRKFLTGAAPAAWIWASIPLTAGFILRSQVGSIAEKYSSAMGIFVPTSIGVTLLVIGILWLKGRGALKLQPVRIRD